MLFPTPQLLHNDPETPWAEPKGSLTKSLACGCRYCDAAYQLVGEPGDVEKDKIKNEDAVLKNSTLSFRQPFKREQEEKDTVNAFINGSGLNFGKGTSYARPENSREVFFIDRRFNVV